MRPAATATGDRRHGVLLRAARSARAFQRRGSGPGLPRDVLARVLIRIRRAVHLISWLALVDDCAASHVGDGPRHRRSPGLWYGRVEKRRNHRDDPIRLLQKRIVVCARQHGQLGMWEQAEHLHCVFGRTESASPIMTMVGASID